MLDEQQETAPAAEADDDAVDVAEAVDAGDGDAGDDDALDVSNLGAEVQTADEPAVSAEELLEIPDAPERWEGGDIAEPGPAAVSEERAQHAADSAEAAAGDESALRIPEE
jgi:hypothetical protein